MKKMVLVVGALCLAGCAHASFLSRTEDAGSLKLHGPRSAAMDDATAKISVACQGRKFQMSRAGRIVTYECSREGEKK